MLILMGHKRHGPLAVALPVHPLETGLRVNEQDDQYGRPTAHLKYKESYLRVHALVGFIGLHLSGLQLLLLLGSN
jgi:hypothetical protein